MTLNLRSMMTAYTKKENLLIPRLGNSDLLPVPHTPPSVLFRVPATAHRASSSTHCAVVIAWLSGRDVATHARSSVGSP
jgi:hypothetical protein